MSVDRSRWLAAALAAAVWALALPALAENAATPATADEPSAAEPTKSGYTTGATLEGGDSVTEDLSQDDLALGSVLRFPRFEKFFEPWFDAKRMLNEKFGLKLNLSYQTLYQWADQTLVEDDAAGGRAQIQGTWTLLGRNTQNPGMLSFRFEHRHTLGTVIPPSRLGGEFGSATSTGTGFSDFGANISEIAWRQTLFGGRMKMVAGKISAIGWYNTHALSSSMRGFQNTALQSSVSRATPGRGIGGGAAVRVGEKFVVLAGIHDANARTPDNPFDTIGEGEFLYSAEVRWLPTSFERRKWDQVRLQLWYQSERRAAGIKSGHGITFVASRLFNDVWMPFILGGISDGDASVYKADVVAGVGLGLNTKHRAARDLLAFAVGWGRPSDDTLQDQYTMELFYRFQLVERIAITPSVQYIVNPVANPNKTGVFVLGLRTRLTF